MSILQDTLQSIYPNKELPDRQSRSIGVSFSGTGVSYDVVPAFADPRRSKVYYIPDIDTNEWIATNPKAHQELATRSNQRTSKKAVPIIKAAKHWNYLVGKPLRSFHLELMAYDILKADPGSWLDGLVSLFDGFVQRQLAPVSDPSGLGPAVDSKNVDQALVKVKGMHQAVSVPSSGV